MKKSILYAAFIAMGLIFFAPAQTVHAAGFVQDAAGVKYQNDDGSFLVNNWVQVGSNIYHLDANGFVQTGWIQVGSLWYLMDASGVCTNPAGTATPPAEASIPAASEPTAQTQNIFSSAGWIPFSTNDANALNNGISAGLVGFDGMQYWAAPQYIQTLNSPAPQANASPAIPNMVWLSATGEKYHAIDHCGRMNPARARQVTLEYALSAGYDKCDKCF